MAPDATAWYAVILLAGAAIFWTWRAGQGQLEREREQAGALERTAARLLQAKSLNDIDDWLRRGLSEMRLKIDTSVYFYRRSSRRLELLDGEAVDIHSPQAGAPSIIATTFRNRVAVYTTETKPAGYLVPMMAGEETLGVVFFSGADLRALEMSMLQHLASCAAVAARNLEQLALQEQMFRHEKLATATQFVHAVAMELREVAEDSPRAHDLVERLLAMGRAEADTAAVSLGDHLNRLFAARRPRWFDRQIVPPDDIAPNPALQVLAPEAQLEQVFTALFDAAEALRPPSIDVAASVRARRARVEIRFSPVLTGPPLTDARRGLIQATLRAMAGELVVVDTLPVRFEVELPLTGQAQPLLEARETRTALVVEADATQRWQLVQLIAQRGVRAVPAESPDDALDRFNQFEFDLVFCPWLGGRPEAMRLIEHVLLAERPAQAFVVAEHEETGAETALEGRAIVLRKPIRDSSLFPLLPAA
jgi:signal transduction histidine kinase/CheY-like chemotaxis protein